MYALLAMVFAWPWTASQIFQHLAETNVEQRLAAALHSCGNARRPRQKSETWCISMCFCDMCWLELDVDDVAMTSGRAARQLHRGQSKGQGQGEDASDSVEGQAQGRKRNGPGFDWGSQVVVFLKMFIFYKCIYGGFWLPTLTFIYFGIAISGCVKIWNPKPLGLLHCSPIIENCGVSPMLKRYSVLGFGRPSWLIGKMLSHYIYI